MKSAFLAMSVVVLLLLSMSALSTAQASPGEIELIRKEWDHGPLEVYIFAHRTLLGYVDDVQAAFSDWSSRLEIASG